MPTLCPDLRWRRSGDCDCTGHWCSVCNFSLPWTRPLLAGRFIAVWFTKANDLYSKAEVIWEGKYNRFLLYAILSYFVKVFLSSLLPSWSSSWAFRCWSLIVVGTALKDIYTFEWYSISRSKNQMAHQTSKIFWRKKWATPLSNIMTN